MDKTKKAVLFICVHNSGRSQLAEALLNKYGSDKFAAESAGLEPGSLNPYVVEVLKKDEEIDISGKKTQAVLDLWKAGRLFYSVITVCSGAEEQGCPIFPGISHRLHWPFDDPSTFTGTSEEILARVKELKDKIKNKILEFIAAG